MTVFLATLLALQLSAPPDPFLIRVDLQALYDELSEMTLSVESAADVDNLQAVLYAPDYVFVDANGQLHPLKDIRDEAIRTAEQSPPEWIAQTIQKVSVTSDGARVQVEQTIERTITDTAGRYGPQGRTHRMTEVRSFRDDWIKSDGAWKLKGRVELGAPKVYVDKPRLSSSLPPSTTDVATASHSSEADPAESAPGTAPRTNDRIFGVLPNYTTVGPNQQAGAVNRADIVRIAALDSFDPYVYPFVGFVALLAQARHQEPAWKFGFSGYEKRYATAFADNTIGNMMTTAVFPLALGQDPRYFVLGQGGVWHRVAYAASRSVVTRRRTTGSRRFNVSEIGGNLTAAALENAYYPSSSRSLTSTAGRWGMQVMWDTLANELKEFWPDIRRRL